MTRSRLQSCVACPLLARALAALPGALDVAAQGSAGDLHCERRSRSGGRDRARRPAADFVGGPQPLSPVPRGARFPAACRHRARPQHPRLRTGAGIAERRPRLGAQHRQPALHRSGGPRQRALHPRQRQGKLPDAGRPSGRRCGSTGTSRSAPPAPGRSTTATARSIDLRLRRAGQLPRPLRPPDGRDRRRLLRAGCAAAGPGRDHGARHFHRRPRRLHRLRRRQSGPADRARRRGLLLPLLSRNGAAQYYRPSRAGYKGGRACEAPDSLPSWQRQARSGSTPPATARSTATRPAPRSRSPCNIRISR